MASKKTFEDLDLSQEELKRIENALKDEKFRKMFVEYAEEISDPANRKRYEEEIAMMEQDRGMDVQFVNPKPGHVLKTIIDGQKAFINICTSDKMGQPTSKKSVSETGVKGLMWQLPHSFSPPREDYDKAKKICMVYDVVFHPDTYTMARNPKFLKLVEDTAIEGIEKQLGVKVDKNNIRRPKNLKYKGSPVATVIRTRKDQQKKESKKDENDILSNMPYPYGSETTAELTEKRAKEMEKKAKDEANKASKTKTTVAKKAEEGFTMPKYSIIHRSDMDIQEFRNAPDSRPSTRPKVLVVTIDLPLCNSATGVDLDIFEDKLSLKSEKPPYKLDLKLPYAVDDENGSAKFDKSKKCLIVTLPVVPGITPDLPKYGEKGQETQQDVPPLIEELPPLEAATDLPPLEDIDEPSGSADEKSEKDDHPECTEKKVKPQISYSLPEYDFNQDSETVTFICHVRNVKDDSVSRSFPSPSSAEVKFLSIGSGGFPMHYCLFVAFDADCRIVPEHTTIDASEKNLTITFLKEKDCRVQWNKVYIGADSKANEVGVI
ncbi:hypothetical protein DPMN_101343 [Dreissena polymorpha]|uniref:Protein kintoun n=1 Tax=Dreissena polymorpha TaxID=45954 RepID=A0A9D4LJS4_DREPO|nr:hypothetical protein DPMN_101343 [Dreissena polymorpha]